MLDDATFRQMFDILSENMQRVNPVPGRPEEIFAAWRDSWQRRMIREDIKCILHRVDGVLRGFALFCFDDASGVISIDELQLHRLSQRDGVTFRKVASLFVSEIEQSCCDTIRAYVNKRNTIPLPLATKLGFEVCGETERGWLLATKKAILVDKLKRLAHRE